MNNSMNQPHIPTLTELADTHVEHSRDEALSFARHVERQWRRDLAALRAEGHSILVRSEVTTTTAQVWLERDPSRVWEEEVFIPNVRVMLPFAPADGLHERVRVALTPLRGLYGSYYQHAA